MTSSAFKKGLESVLFSVGFERFGRVFRRCGSGVTTVIAFHKGFGDEWSINVGFWLDALSSEQTDRVEQAHVYLRLERILPEYREVILFAGALNDPEQPQAYADFRRLLATEIDSALHQLGTETGLATAMTEGRLNQGLVRKEARAHLKKKFHGYPME